jgi:hypothetical protein
MAATSSLVSVGNNTGRVVNFPTKRNRDNDDSKESTTGNAAKKARQALRLKLHEGICYTYTYISYQWFFYHDPSLISVYATLIVCPERKQLPIFPGDRSQPLCLPSCVSHH